MTADDILSGITDQIKNRNDVAAVVWLFRITKTKDRLQEIGKHLADEKDSWDKGDLDVLRREYKICLGKHDDTSGS